MSAGGIGGVDSGEHAGPAPVLPPAEARPPVPMAHRSPVVGSQAWYRSDQQRYRSVYRRANPWYRRLARGVIGLSLLAAIGAGLYFGAGVVQDYLDRDRLPPLGREAAAFRSTTFLVTSAAPAPEVDGTITIDTESRAFEFIGRAQGPQAGLQIVSPDGARTFVRASGGEWRAADGSDPDVVAVTTAIPYLLSFDDADALLENQLRKGYVDLVDQTTEGADADARERYELELDTRGYSVSNPLQWQQLQETVVPGIAEASAVPVTMWIDADDVVVRFRDEQAHWAWERLAYSPAAFAPADPTAG